MKSINKYFSPKKEDSDEDPDFIPTKSKSARKQKPKESLLKIVDEVEDITALLFSCNEQYEQENGIENEQEDDSSNNQVEDVPKIAEVSPPKSPRKRKSPKKYVSKPRQKKSEIPIFIPSPISSPERGNASPLSPQRVRRFSFNIKSPVRAPLKPSIEIPPLTLSPGTATDSLFDEARNIHACNTWDTKNKDENEAHHPKKRFKTQSFPPLSHPENYPYKDLVAKKLVIPCLQLPSAFPDPPKNKEFYNLRQTISNSKQKNYVIMSRTCVKKNAVYLQIETILTHRMKNSSQDGRVMEFLVKWSDFSEKYTSWEPEEHFKCSPELLLSYVMKLLTNVGRNSSIAGDLKVIKRRLKTKLSRIDAVKSQEHIWQLNAELSAQALKTQYKKLLKQYAHKVQEELGPSFPTVEILNTVDYNLPPLNFTFVRDRFAGKGVHISDDTLIGCICSGEYGVKDCCLAEDVECCPHLGGVAPPYNNKGRLTIKRGYPIYECNARCSCGPDCGNRIVQRGTQVKTAIYKTVDKGWGLKTLQTIPKGTFVVEYVGEVITFDEAEQRGKEYDAQGLTYLFDLDYQTTEGLDVDDGMFTIDAAFYGNTSHFINHSCDPNLAVFTSWISNLDIRLPHICLFAVKPIPAGEELTFNYQIDRIVEEENRAAQRLSVECRCGTKKCVRYLHG